jgi:sugar phosphate isomerase/epimerase
MKTDRRRFLSGAAAAAGALAASVRDTVAAEPKPAREPAIRELRMRLGTVTYNLAKDWDVETIIKHCAETGFQGVELRTTHAHGVEVSLSRGQRDEVRRRFQDSPVELHSLGSAFDYHTPDQARLRKDIEATKEYIVLAHDVGAVGVKVRPNGLPKEVPVEKTLEQIGQSLRELGRFSEGYGIEIRVEVHGAGTALLPNMKRIMDVADHPQVGVCWNSNPTDLDGQGFDHNFDLVKDKLMLVHMRDLFVEDYPFRRLLRRLNEIEFAGFCLAEIPPSTDPLRVMRYYRALWLAYQDLL